MDLIAQASFGWSSWLLAGAAVLVIGIAKSGFGGGVGVLAVPMFVVAMGPRIGVGAMLPLLIAADCLSVYHHWGNWDRRNLKVLMPGALVGLVLGSALLAWLVSGSTAENDETLKSAERPMQIVIGVVCVLYVVADLIRMRFAEEWRWQANAFTGTIAGVLAGVVSTLAHAAGPIVTIFLLGQHLPKRPLIGTAVIFFLIVNVLKLAPYAALELINGDTIRYGLWLLPLAPVGTWMGARLNRVMSEQLFRGTVMAIVFLTGVKLVVGG